MRRAEAVSSVLGGLCVQDTSNRTRDSGQTDACHWFDFETVAAYRLTQSLVDRPGQRHGGCSSCRPLAEPISKKDNFLPAMVAAFNVWSAT
jgi:hypothetical protein